MNRRKMGCATALVGSVMAFGAMACSSHGSMTESERDATSYGSQGAVADAVLTDARIWTGDKTRPWAEALAVRGGKILAVGTAAEMAVFRGPSTEWVQAQGKFVTPGFRDSMSHLLQAATAGDTLDLASATDAEGVKTLIRSFADQHPGAGWINGGGWVPSQFDGKAPNRQQLDAVVPHRPVFLLNGDWDYSVAWVNSKALEEVGIDGTTQDPKGGTIVRDPSTKEPTGLLLGAAVRFVSDRIPAPDLEVTYRQLRGTLEALGPMGITSVHEGNIDRRDAPTQIALFERLAKESGDRMSPVRIDGAVAIHPDDYSTAISEIAELGRTHRGSMVRYGTVKIFLDGIVEAHTAAMLEPYADDPGKGAGEPVWSVDDLNRAVLLADDAGLQVSMHAVGDRAVRMGLDAVAYVQGLRGRPMVRPRINHIEVIAPSDIPRFKALDVTASMQPLMATFSPSMEKLWLNPVGKERAQRGFAWRTLEDAGARVVFGSDWPDNTPDVFQGLYMAVTRRNADGNRRLGWNPTETIPIESALRHYTADGAYASRLEHEIGSLSVGKWADYVVLSDNLLETSQVPERLLRTKVLETVVGGRTVYRAPTP